jgi:hypothetical protein
MATTTPLFADLTSRPDIAGLLRRRRFHHRRPVTDHTLLLLVVRPLEERSGGGSGGHIGVEMLAALHVTDNSFIDSKKGAEDQ